MGVCEYDGYRKRGEAIMSRVDLYSCDQCGAQSSQKMDAVKVSVTFGSLCMVGRQIGSPAGDVHICQACAKNISDAVKNAISESVCSELQQGWEK